METKICNCCGQEKLLSDFYSTKNGYIPPKCKECARKQSFQNYWKVRGESRPYRTVLNKVDVLCGEIWKTLVSQTQSIYVSSFGRIAFEREGERYLFSQVLDKCGYMRIKQVDGFTPLVHRLVATAFIGTIPKGKEVNHKNGNKQDNRVDNLEVVTHKENMNHAVAVLGFRFDFMKGRCGNKHHLSMPVLCLDRSGNLVQEYESVRMAAKLCGLNASNISAVCNGKYGHITCGGYFWKYK